MTLSDTTRYSHTSHQNPSKKLRKFLEIKKRQKNIKNKKYYCRRATGWRETE